MRIVGDFFEVCDESRRFACRFESKKRPTRDVLTARQRRGVQRRRAHAVDRNTTRSGIGDKTNAAAVDSACGQYVKRGCRRVVGGYRSPTTSYPETGYGPGLRRKRFARQVTHNPNSPATTSRASPTGLFLAAAAAECTSDNTPTVLFRLVRSQTCSGRFRNHVRRRILNALNWPKYSTVARSEFAFFFLPPPYSFGIPFIPTS